MSDSALFSEHWHRVRHLKPRLADDVVVVQQLYRRVPTWILHRRSTTDYQRLSAPAWWLVQRFDGAASVDDVWKRALHAPGGEAPTQTQFIELLARLHETDLLVVDRRIGVESLFTRGEDRRKRDRVRDRLNPLFARFPLCDPDRLLEHLSNATRWVTGRWFGWSLAVLSVVTGWMLLPRADEFARQLAAFDPLDATRILTFVFAYPVMKLVHELAHGLVLKRYGGEVREAGVAVMVLVPLPYVNASDAILLTDKGRRLLVSAAGVLAEVSIAVLAALVWCLSDDGVQQLALTVFAIGGVSTLVFNGNPLLRFDAYYLLADAIEIPNLYARAQQAVVDAGRRYLLGLPPIGARVEEPAERRWLLAYGLVSGLFRIILLGGVALMLGGRYFLFGVALALWIAVSTLLLPLWRFCRFAIDAPDGRAWRARAAATVMVCALIGLVFLPLPRRTVAEGIVWLPDDALVRAPDDCRVDRLRVRPGHTVSAADRLLDCANDDLTVERAVVLAELEGLVAERQALATYDGVRRRVLSLGIGEAQGRLASIDARLAALDMRAAVAGEFVSVDSASLASRHFRRGELIGYVVPETRRSIRLAIPETAASAIDERPLQIEFVLVGDRQRWEVHRSSYSGATGRAVRRVRHAALTRAGGGSLEVVDGPDGGSLRHPVFEIELPWPNGVPTARVGSRLQARLARPSASLFDLVQETLQQWRLERSAA